MGGLSFHEHFTGLVWQTFQTTDSSSPADQVGTFVMRYTNSVFQTLIVGFWLAEWRRVVSYMGLLVLTSQLFVNEMRRWDPRIPEATTLEDKTVVHCTGVFY